MNYQVSEENLRNDGVAGFSAALSCKVKLLLLCMLPLLLLCSCASPLAKEFDDVYDEYVTEDKKEGEETDEDEEEGDYPELTALDEEEAEERGEENAEEDPEENPEESGEETPDENEAEIEEEE